MIAQIALLPTMIATHVAVAMARGAGAVISNAGHGRVARRPARKIRFTRQETVDRLVAAYRAEQQRSVLLESENLKLREELEAARRVFRRLHPSVSV